MFRIALSYSDEHFEQILTDRKTGLWIVSRKAAHVEEETCQKASFLMEIHIETDAAFAVIPILKV